MIIFNDTFFFDLLLFSIDLLCTFLALACPVAHQKVQVGLQVSLDFQYMK